MKDKNIRFITVSVLVGIVLTITIGIFALVYSHDGDIERDKYYADHCKQVSKSTDKSYSPEIVTYSCGGK